MVIKAMQAISRSRCLLYTWTFVFLVYSNEKSLCTLYTRFYGIGLYAMHIM